METTHFPTFRDVMCRKEPRTDPLTPIIPRAPIRIRVDHLESIFP